jgi:hypothetical protein
LTIFEVVAPKNMGPIGGVEEDTTIYRPFWLKNMSGVGTF